MKYRLCCIVALTTFIACTRTVSPDPAVPPPPLTDGPVKSLTTYSSGVRTRTVQWFSYDENQMLSGMRVYVYDSTFDPVIDSLFLTIGRSDAGKPPAEYDILYQYHWAPAGGLSEHHMLFYDNLNRIIRDSIADGNNDTNFSSVLFSYDAGGNVMGRNISYVTGTPPQVQINESDSFLIESENITYDLRFGALQLFSHDNNVTYSTYQNPLYNDFLAKTVGITLVFHNYGNFRNKNLPSYALLIDQNFNALTFHYSWATDAKGRVVNGIGEAGSEHDEYIYTY